MIAQAEAELAATAAEIARAKYDVDRYRSLIQGQYASLQRFQQADADYKKATAADQKARAAVTAAERELDVIDTQKQQTQADLAAAIADRDTAQLNLCYTELRAPIDGVIGNRSARRGAFAPVGAQLISLVPAEGLWIDANFKESQLARMQPGLPVRIEADVLPGEVFIGHVGSLAPATGAEFSILPPENATGNFTKIVQRVPVRILLDGDAAKLGRLRPGLSVTVAVDERGEGTRTSEHARRPDPGPGAGGAEGAGGRAPRASSPRPRRSSPSPPCASASSSRCWISRSSRRRCGTSAAGSPPAPTRPPGCRPAISSPRSS